MSDAAVIPAAKPALSARVLAHPLVRILIGSVLTFLPVPLIMIFAQKLVEKPYRVVWPQLLAAVVVFLAYRFFAHRIEKRSLTELGAQAAVRETSLGLLLGAGLVGIVFALLGFAGIYQLDAINAVSVTLLIPLAEFVLVGMTEEMIFRGIIFRITAKSLGNRWAIMISALVFGLAHMPNEGISLVAVAAIIAYGVLQAAIYIRTSRLWLCIGSHIAWNFCVGKVFSVAVSGHGPETGLLRGQLIGSDLWTGGSFGVEGSLVTLIVISIAAVWFLRKR